LYLLLAMMANLIGNNDSRRHNNNNNRAMILACSPSLPTTNTTPSNSSSPTLLSKSVQSLQAKLTAARTSHNNHNTSSTTTQINEQNAFILQYKNGVAVDENGYPLCRYRKKFFDHLKVKSVITSTLRVTIQQATMIVANFMSQQLENDLKRNTLVDEGELTQFDADIQAEEWEKVEWKKRWKTFPLKVLTALTKFHAVTLILRSYEYMAEKVMKCDLYTMDKLTMDPFQMSKRLVVQFEMKSSPSSISNSTTRSPADVWDTLQAQKKETVMDHKGYVIYTMTATTFWSNLLSFCADYSLHQGLLCYGYYKYYNYQRQKRLTIIAAAAAAADDDSDYSDNCDYSSAIAITDDDKLLAKDLLKKSVRLGGNRGLGLVCSAIGGGVGSLVWPGWGVVVGSAMGDNVAGFVLDDGFYKAKEILEDKQKKEELKDANQQSQ